MNSLEKIFSSIKSSNTKQMKLYSTNELINQLPEYEDYSLFILKNIYLLITSDVYLNRICGAKLLQSLRFFSYTFDFKLSDSPVFSDFVYLQFKDIKEGSCKDLHKQKNEIKKTLLAEFEHVEADFFEDKDMERITFNIKLNTTDVTEKEITNIYDFFEALNLILLSPNWNKRHGAFIAYAAIVSSEHRQFDFDYDLKITDFKVVDTSLDTLVDSKLLNRDRLEENNADKSLDTLVDSKLPNRDRLAENNADKSLDKLIDSKLPNRDRLEESNTEKSLDKLIDSELPNRDRLEEDNTDKSLDTLADSKLPNRDRLEENNADKSLDTLVDSKLPNRDRLEEGNSYNNQEERKKYNNNLDKCKKAPAPLQPHKENCLLDPGENSSTGRKGSLMNSRTKITLSGDLFNKIFEILKNDKFNDFQDDVTSSPVREAACILLKYIYPMINNNLILHEITHILSSLDWQEQFSGLLALTQLKDHFTQSLVDGENLVDNFFGILVSQLESDDEDVKFLSSNLISFIIEHFIVPLDIAEQIKNLCWEQIEADNDISHSKASLLILLKTIYTKFPINPPTTFSSLYSCFTSPITIIRNSALELSKVFNAEEFLYLLSEGILLETLGEYKHIEVLRSKIEKCKDRSVLVGYAEHFLRIMSLDVSIPYNEDDFACYDDTFFTADGIKSIGPVVVMDNRACLFKEINKIENISKFYESILGNTLQYLYLAYYQSVILKRKDGRNTIQQNPGIINCSSDKNQEIANMSEQLINSSKQTNSITGDKYLESPNIKDKSLSNPRDIEQEHSNIHAPRTNNCEPKEHLDSCTIIPTNSEDNTPQLTNKGEKEQDNKILSLSDVITSNLVNDFKKYKSLKKMPIKEFQKIIQDFGYLSLYPLAYENCLELVRMYSCYHIYTLKDFSLYFKMERSTRFLECFCSVLITSNYKEEIAEILVEQLLVCDTELRKIELEKSFEVSKNFKKKIQFLKTPLENEKNYLEIVNEQLINNILIFFKILGKNFIKFKIFTQLMQNKNRLNFFKYTIANYIEYKEIEPIFYEALEKKNVKILKIFIQNIFFNCIFVKKMLQNFNLFLVSNLIEHSDPSFNVLFVKLILQDIGKVSENSNLKELPENNNKEEDITPVKDTSKIPFFNETIDIRTLLSTVICSLHFKPNTNIQDKELLALIAKEKEEIKMIIDPTLIKEYKMIVPVAVALRDYQKEGIKWISFLSRFNLNGILADDMGLGKTLQVLCFVINEMYLLGTAYLGIKDKEFLTNEAESSNTLEHREVQDLDNSSRDTDNDNKGNSKEIGKRNIDERLDGSSQDTNNASKIKDKEACTIIKGNNMDGSSRSKDNGNRSKGKETEKSNKVQYLDGSSRDALINSNRIQGNNSNIKGKGMRCSNKIEDMEEITVYKQSKDIIGHSIKPCKNTTNYLDCNNKETVTSEDVNKVINSSENSTLIVCPSSLTSHWKDEIKKYFNVDSSIYDSKKDQSTAIVICSYDMLRRDTGVLEKKRWFIVVFDEGHLLKNRNTVLYAKAKKLVSQKKLILTGTPIHNSVEDLFSLFDILMPSYLGRESTFVAQYSCKVNDKNVEVMKRRLEALHKKTLPFIMRRLKTEVLKDLPPKIITDLSVQMSSAQAQLYKKISGGENVGDAQHRTVNNCKEDPSNNKNVNYNTLKNCSLVTTKNQLKVASHPHYFDKALTSAKTTALQDIFSMSGNSKILIFFQFRATIDFVLADLNLANYLRLDGSVPPNQRGEIVRKFNTEDIPYLFLTTSIGGLGLNLTSANIVVFYEHDWNPFNDLQAMDRAHRLGQKLPVSVFRLICKGTVEETVMNYQNFKLYVANSIVTQQNNEISQMDTKDLLERFQ